MADVFCIQPWLGKETKLTNGKKYKECCWLSKDYDIDQVRKDLTQGIKTSACQRCWDAESNDLISRRQQQNLLADTLYNLSIENLQKLCIEQGYAPTIYQINTGNKCNGACIMCGPKASSKWQSLLKQHSPHTELPYDHEFDLDFDNAKFVDFGLDFDNAKFVEFLGGEPLLEKKVIPILEKLNKDCCISFVTNGSISIDKKLLDLLRKFNKLIICLSIDGIGPVFEYHRWPLKWNKLLENLEQFRSLECDLSVSYTLTNINLPYYDETISWFKSQNLKYLINKVRHPEYFDPDNPISKKTISALDKQDLLKGINRKDYGFNF